ncbi:MAG TPA: rod shape-determining protein MreC [Chloroflexota bacterium]|nr:rod shape-determining protein MreC [Chloroflexota bacterium]
MLCLTPFPGRSLIEQASSTVLTPVQFGVSGTFGEIGSVIDTVQRVRDLAQQNRAYRDQLDELQSDVVRLHELEVENRELRNLLNLRERTGPGPLIPAAVIARDDTPYVQAITVDRGANDGVKGDAVVITHKGLVGRVERVNPTSAKVRLINDINSSVGVRLQTESRTTGVLRGQSQGNLMVIAYIPQTDDVQQGAVVITSGLGEVFPEGLVVGKVARVERKDADPFQAAVVEPAVEMNKLERLYILSDAGDR